MKTEYSGFNIEIIQDGELFTHKVTNSLNKVYSEVKGYKTTGNAMAAAKRFISNWWKEAPDLVMDIEELVEYAANELSNIHRHQTVGKNLTAVETQEAACKTIDKFIEELQARAYLVK